MGQKDLFKKCSYPIRLYATHSQTTDKNKNKNKKQTTKNETK